MRFDHGRFAASALASVALLAACGSDDGGAGTATQPPQTTQAADVAASTTTAVAPPENAPATFNDADVAFAQGMIAHHEQAIEMAEMALDPAVGARAEVVDLATRIQAAQDPEIQQMTAWLTAWGQPLAMTTDGHEMSEMEGMMTAEEMDELGSMTGEAFDAMWLQMMIEHHQGAIAQSTTEEDTGVNADAVALAGQIISAQQAEIDEMQALLDG